MALAVCTSTRRLRFVLQALLLIVLAGAPGPAGAQTTVTLDAPDAEVSADATIRDGGYASVNYGQNDSLESKVSPQTNYNRRIVLKFDTANYIPAGAVINSAKLYLTLKEADDSTSRPFNVYRLATSFQNTQVTWYDRKTGQRWSKSGGDLAEKYGTTYVGATLGAAYAFDLTQLVQRTVRGEFGSRYTRVALVDSGPAASGSYRRFHSSRSASTSLRPKLVISYGGSTTSTPDVSTSGGTLRVMQWNIHKTKGSDNTCNPDRTASWLVKLGADIIGVNEVLYYGGCSYTADQGVTLENLVEKKSGRTWYRKFVNGDGKVGNLILSRLPFASSATRQLSYGRGAVQASVIVNGRTVNVFSTHVDYANASWRTQQTNQVKSWMSTFSSPRIVTGDFNTNPGTSDYSIMASAYGDSWVDAKSAGTATSYNGTGATHGGSRFDYVYYTKSTPVVLKSVNVPTTKTSGVAASDHDPVIAVFEVK